MMKKNAIRTFLVVIIAGIFIVGCAQVAIEEAPSVEIPEVEEAVPTEQMLSPTEPVMTARFTITADEPLHDAISALYAAFFSGETPVYVENDADLIAIRSTPSNDMQPAVQATFLPESVLIPTSNLEDVEAFIQFAVSPEGQQILIDLGELPETITITDQAGNPLEIEQPIRRVITAYGPSTAILYSINASDRLVSASYLGARDPQGAAAMERIDPRFQSLIGDTFFNQQDFNIEQAALLDPDLIIASSRTDWTDTAKQVGINVFLMEAETPEALKQAVLLIGQLFGPNTYAQAQAWVIYYENVVETIQSQIGTAPMQDPVRVLFTGTEPLRVASGEMYQTDIIEAAGGESVSTELGGYWNDVNIEQIAIWDPDVIIVPPYGGASVEAITESSEWQILDAVQLGQVFRMPKLVVPWDTPAPDSVLGIIWMAVRINSDRVTLSCSEEAEYFYNTFYNYAITGEELAVICNMD